MKQSFIILTLLLGFALAQRESCAQSFWNLPQRPGQNSVYTYGGNVTWVEGSEVKSDSIVWHMRILDAVERGNISAWKITGHPMDLAWYKPGMKPIVRTIVEVAGKSYYITAAGVFDRIKNKDDKLNDLVWESELALDLPLSKARAFGESQNMRREDGMYVWRVEDIQTADVPNGNGVTEEDFTYTVVYRAKNSVILTEWQKGVGLLRYRYRHLGASTDCDVRLERAPPGVKLDR